jgi:glycosyltransferase involved in cell wall biosynthesis
MRILYIGHYRDGTGWGNAALNNILSLDSAGIDVVPRAITYEDKDRSYPDRIKDLEANNSTGCDVVIQHTLPSNFTYNSNFKNIGILTCETSNFKSTGWQHNCNLMDELWVSSVYTRQQVIDSGVTKPVKVIPYGLDIDKYKESNGQKIQQLVNSFTFGFIGEFIERKNVKALVQAYHLEFDPREPVNLFIKTSKKDLEHVQGYFKHIRKGMKLRDNYKEEVVICGMMPEEDYLSIMSQIDCFVIPSRGEACCIPSLEAMAMGIPTIYTEGIGVDHAFGNGVPVKSYPTPCFGAIETLPNLDTAEADWKEIDIRELAKAMRDMYTKGIDERTKSRLAEQAKKYYSYEAVGARMKEALNDC